ncbi:copper amine oxidase N-terminal domain-containing protein [Paenibacillus sp. SI8]|uniref:copper amine oxidase N-terminal domain-containing protein n=1 Tax=unclassified Paenibacillus TaxID=185978 RepID=UPI003466BBF6
MPKKRLQWWTATALILLLFALTGCQAVQGLEIGQALQNSSTAKSLESRGSFELELTPGDTDQLAPEQKALLQALKNTKITINDAKMQDKRHVSVNGEFEYLKGKVPFQIVLDDMKYTISIAGGKKPIVFDLKALAGSGAASPLSQEIQEKLMKSSEQLQPALLKFFINNAPNPNKISVSSVTEQVYNETLNLQKVHAEIDGTELTGLLKQFLTSVLADEKGLKELLSQLYDVVMPIIKEQVQTLQSAVGEKSPKLKSSFDPSEMAMAYMDNKTLCVEFAYTTIQIFLKKAVDQFDTVAKDTLSSSNSEQLQAVLSKKTSLVADLYIDQDKQVRKTKYQLELPISNSDSGIAAFKLTAAFEYWNINKPVTADTIDISGGVLSVDPTFDSTTFLNNFDKNSQFYKLLKDDLKVTRKEIHFIVEGQDDSNGDGDLYADYGPPRPYINDEQVTMVSARFLSERLGAQVKWNEDLKQVTVQDASTGTTIIMTVGSKTATVGGTSVELESAPVLRHGATYVPIRFIAEKLGAKVEFDNDTQLVTITRD